MLQTIILIAFGGALGSVSRYLAATGVYSILGRNFPYGTLVVNVTGSLIIGFISVLLIERFAENASVLRSLLIIGFLGGYTTFSSFSLETLNLLENGEFFSALLNVSFSVILCLLAVWLGAIIGRNL